MLTPTEQRAVFALLLHAALADGSKSDSERAALKRITEGFAADSFNPWTLYQDVLSGRVTVAVAAADLTRPETRVLAYEMAVGVCDTDGPPNPAERGFLQDIEIAKVGSFEQALIGYFNRDHAELMAKINVKGDFNDEIDAGIKAGIEKFKATQTW